MQNDRHSDYYAAIHDANEALEDALQAIREETSAGRITPAEAATERAGLLERHLAECQRLRRELLVRQPVRPEIMEVVVQRS